VIGAILARTAISRPEALFFDFDGTLVRIRRKPDLARLSPARMRILETLSRNVFIAVISGRSLSAIRSLVGIPELAYAGSHGLEIAFRGVEWCHPGIAGVMDILPALVKEIRSSLGSLPGLFIEDKECSVAVHFRLTPRGFHKKIEHVIEEVVFPFQSKIQVIRGKMVMEIRPAFPWNKGNALRKIAEMAGIWGRHPLLYIGDDSTDEDAFAALTQEDISIRVGKKPGSMAHFHLDTVAEVWKLIGKLGDMV
jgi:trehalose 6-phosphate phosphatase